MRALSLRAKVFLLFAGAALLTVSAALVLTARAVEDQVYERATNDLIRAGGPLGYYWNSQNQLLLLDARARARDPTVTSLLLRGDTIMLRRLLQQGLPEGSVALATRVLLPDSTPTDTLAAGSTAGAMDTAARAIAFERLVGPRLDSASLASPGGYGSVIVPPGAKHPLRVSVYSVWSDGRVVGVIGVGAPLDSTVVRRLQEAAQTDVVLVVGDSVIGGTLPDSVIDALEAHPELFGSRTIRRLPLAGEEYLMAAYSLPTRGVPAAVLLSRPVSAELKVVRGIVGSLVGIGFAALVLALVLAGVVARIVARPAQTLAEAAGHLARGDYGAPLPPASGDEIGQLTTAFAEMRSAIAEREARLRSAQAELIHREKLAAMGRLVAQLSHEINNPIYNIQNCLEALERRGDPSDPNREFLELAQEELGRLAGLTRQLLDQSRPLSDAAIPLDLNAVVRRVVTLSASQLDGRGIRTELALDSHLPRIVAHPDAIRQVLANLVANAADAMPSGGLLRIETRASGDAVEIAVVDTGTGIAAEHLPHIFDAFYTTKPEVRGIGLGLFVSEGIIRGHRGRLSVESRPGEGSRFVIQLPRETLDSTISEAAMDPSEDVTGAPALVEDISSPITS